MKIGAGRYYKTQDGETVGPMWLRNAGEWAAGAAEQGWNDDGYPIGYMPQTTPIFCQIVEEIGITNTPRPGDVPGSRDRGEAGATARPMADLLYGDDPNRITKAGLLDAAKATVADRGANYGGVEDNFGRIAALWNAHLGNRPAGPLAPTDVAQMMALMKIARLENDPSHLDSWTDLAGYAACGAEISA